MGSSHERNNVPSTALGHLASEDLDYTCCLVEALFEP
jgi:hypothetical protein